MSSEKAPNRHNLGSDVSIESRKIVLYFYFVVVSEKFLELIRQQGVLRTK